LQPQLIFHDKIELSSLLTGRGRGTYSEYRSISIKCWCGLLHALWRAICFLLKRRGTTTDGALELGTCVCKLCPDGCLCISFHYGTAGQLDARGPTNVAWS